MEDRFYIPHNIRKQSLINKQGSSTDVLSAEVADTFIKDVEMVSKLSYQKYTDAVAAGIARELARILLPVNIYTEFYWKIDLRNLLHFIELRADPHAQYEIRRYAEDMTLLIEPYVPAAIQAFRDYVLNSVTLSSIEVRALEVEHASIAPPLLHKASKTEIAEWEAKFRRLNPSQI
jgi:thymidylate synthase (FAD)